MREGYRIVKEDWAGDWAVVRGEVWDNCLIS